MPRKKSSKALAKLAGEYLGLPREDFCQRDMTAIYPDVQALAASVLSQTEPKVGFWKRWLGSE